MFRLLSVVSGVLIMTILYALFPTRHLPTATVCDRLIVFKKRKILQLWSKGKLVKVYKVALGKVPVGAKSREGDMRTPEGSYFIHDKNPKSAFYLNLGISYPNDRDQAHAEANGLKPGSAIKIHGLRNGCGWRGRFHRYRNWTAGCIALTNAEIEELYRAVPLHTPINIYP
ncbi:murein L,D-transpeptidase YafK [Catalinimonas alkaloidigena]|uniref:L,D-transpeptidase family protein n=1 Tax=Catalinimonas alkaloidigena TaxID=1075417 RepID=UPI0024074048|nr:L,D-transpeptidase family protein [Catalinimonas alkaloidigena]MDF9798183.1 murein L,D-transpeptidase YafK [Catalinimonas alkaloidigena]